MYMDRALNGDEIIKALDNRGLHQFALNELKVNIFVSNFTIFSSEIFEY